MTPLAWPAQRFNRTCDQPLVHPSSRNALAYARAVLFRCDVDLHASAASRAAVLICRWVMSSIFEARDELCEELSESTHACDRCPSHVNSSHGSAPPSVAPIHGSSRRGSIRLPMKANGNPTR